MSDSNADHPELGKDMESTKALINQLLDDGDLSDSDWNQLHTALEKISVARRYYVQMISLDGALSDHFDKSEDVSLANLNLNILRDENFRQGKFSDRKGMSRWLIGVMGTACFVVLMVGFLLFIPTTTVVQSGQLIAYEPTPLGADAKQSTASQPVARIDQARQIIWHKVGQTPLGTLIRPGTIGITGGSIRLTLNSGTQITLRGPAALQIVDSNSVVLEHGRASFHIPELSDPIEVSTKGGKITDLGTDFSAEVWSSMESIRIGVTDGKALFSPHEILDQPITIEADTGVIVDGESSQPKEFKEVITWNAKQMPNRRLPSPGNYYRWHFNKNAEIQKEVTAASGPGAFVEVGKHESVENHMATAVDSSDLQPEFNQGKFGTGVQFPSENSQPNATYTGLTANIGKQDFTNPYSVCFWFKPNSAGGAPQCLLTTTADDAEADRPLWKISMFPNIAAQTATPDRLFLKTKDGTFAFPIQAMDDQWHHFAFINYGNDPVDFPAENMIVFIDGKAAPPSSMDLADNAKSRKSLPVGKTATTLHIANPVSQNDPIDHVGFSGGMDEVHVFEAALTAAQVQRLYSTGKPIPARELLPTQQPPAVDPAVPFDWDYVWKREVLPTPNNSQ